MPTRFNSHLPRTPRSAISALSLLLCLLLAACEGVRKEPGLLEAVGVLPSTIRPLGQSPRHTSLQLMSFNIRYATASDGENSWPNRRPLVRDLIRAHDPDVLGLQEVLKSQLDALRDDLPQYSTIGVGRDDGRTAGEYAPILYRADRFVATDGGTFWLSDTPEVPGSKAWGNTLPRICTWVRLTERGGVPQGGRAGDSFYIFNVHLDHQSEPSRRRAAHLLAERILARAFPADPMFVTGDFNCPDESPAIQFLTGRLATPDEAIPKLADWNGLRDSYRLVHGRASDESTFHAFSGSTAGQRIDFILTWPTIQIEDAQIIRTSRDGRYPSDHFPVSAILRLP